MKISEIVKAYRKENDLTMDEFAERSGLSKGYISRLENEKPQKNTGKISKPSIETLRKIAGCMMISLDDLIRRMDDNEKIDISPPRNVLPIPPTKKIPMLGSVACGEPIYCNQEFTYIEGPIKADFCLRAQGDSMTGARIQDGDLVFCRSQQTVANGEIAVVIVDDSATLKRFYHYPGKNTIILKADNPGYDDQIYMGDELEQIRIIGKAVAFQSTIR